jgi:hypothetical protein
MRADRRRRHAWVTREQRIGARGTWSSRCAICELEIEVSGGFGLDKVIEAARDASSCPGREHAPTAVGDRILAELLEKRHE